VQHTTWFPARSRLPRQQHPAPHKLANNAARRPAARSPQLRDSQRARARPQTLRSKTDAKRSKTGRHDHGAKTQSVPKTIPPSVATCVGPRCLVKSGACRRASEVKLGMRQFAKTGCKKAVVRELHAPKRTCAPLIQSACNKHRAARPLRSRQRSKAASAALSGEALTQPALQRAEHTVNRGGGLATNALTSVECHPSRSRRRSEESVIASGQRGVGGRRCRKGRRAGSARAWRCQEHGKCRAPDSIGSPGTGARSLDS